MMMLTCSNVNLEQFGFVEFNFKDEGFRTQKAGDVNVVILKCFTDIQIVKSFEQPSFNVIEVELRMVFLRHDHHSLNDANSELMS